MQINIEKMLPLRVVLGQIPGIETGQPAALAVWDVLQGTLSSTQA